MTNLKTFQSFITGPCNNKAYLAAKDAAAGVLDSLILTGGTSTGKTHLLHAVRHFCAQADPLCRVRYFEAEQLLSDLIRRISGDDEKSLMDRLDGIDLILIDDLHVINGKERTREEFLYFLHKLHKKGKRIILATAELPREPLNKSGPALFLDDCINVFLDYPDRATRKRWLIRQCRDRDLVLKRHMVKMIVNADCRGIGELNGVLNRFVLEAALRKKIISPRTQASTL